MQDVGIILEDELVRIKFLPVILCSWSLILSTMLGELRTRKFSRILTIHPDYVFLSHQMLQLIRCPLHSSAEHIKMVKGFFYRDKGKLRSKRPLLCSFTRWFREQNLCRRVYQRESWIGFFWKWRWASVVYKFTFETSRACRTCLVAFYIPNGGIHKWKISLTTHNSTFTKT